MKLYFLSKDKILSKLCLIAAFAVIQKANSLETSTTLTGDKQIDSSVFFYDQTEYPRDCSEVKDQCLSSNSSGVYVIKPDGYPDSFEVYCDNSEDSGGWTVIQRRTDLAINFNRTWEDYKKGFGFISKEFWLGNEKLSYLTNQKKYQLFLEIKSSDGHSVNATFDNFSISDEFSNYKLICKSTGSPSGIKRDCQDWYDAGFAENGIYTIKPSNWPGSPFNVSCNMTDGGGWTVFQRRDGTIANFHHMDWAHYSRGFGNLDTEFWLGNEQLHYLTNQKVYELRIDFVNRYGAPYYAKYSRIRINNASDKYRLSELGSYSGTACATTGGRSFGGPLYYHVGCQFSTSDSDNDFASYDCAAGIHGAWWHRDCGSTFLNGQWDSSSFKWYDLPGGDKYIKYTEMKIRPNPNTCN